VTGPRVDVPQAPPLSRVLSPDEFDQMQSLPGSAVQKVTADKTTTGLSRVLSPEEFDHAQSMSGPAIKALRIPALPPIVAAPKDAVARVDPTKIGTKYSDQVKSVVANPTLRHALNSEIIPGLGPVAMLSASADLLDQWATSAEKATKPDTWTGEVVRNVASPMMHHPWMTAGMVGATMIPLVGPVVAAAMGGDMASNVALYGYQRHLENTATPGARAIMEADPERISGKAAVIQAAMLAVLPALHAGIKGVKAPDFGAGMMEAGAAGIRDLGATPEASARLATPQGAEVLGSAASTHGLPETANPYPPETPLATAWKEGHASTTEPAQPTPAEGAHTPTGEPAPASDAVAAASAPAQAAPTETRTPVAIEVYRGAPTERGLADNPSTGGATFASTDPATGAAYAKEGSGGVLHKLTGTLQHPLITSSLAEYRKALGLPEGSTQEQGIAAARAAGYDGIIHNDGRLVVILDNSRVTAETVDHTTDHPFGRIEPQAPVVVQRPPAQAAPLSPVDGTGPAATRGVSRSIEARAVAAKLTDTLGELPKYQKANFAEHADRALQFLADDPARARDVALGNAPAPEGLIPEMVSIAVENRAIHEGDVATLRDLATSKLAEEGTTMGQRIAAYATRDQESPVAAIQHVVDVRARAVKNVPKATADVVATIRKQISASAKKPKDWNAFIDSLRC
jgi:hypothetical protein